MEATKRLKAQGLRKGGLPKRLKEEMEKQKDKKERLLEKFKKKAPGKKKKLTPQEQKEMMDKINKSKGKMTNPFIKLDSMGRPTMEAAKGGVAKKFPDLSGDGKVTMKDILVGRGAVKKPKGKADGGSMTLEGGKLKGVKDAPEERRREQFRQRRKTLGGLGALVIKGAGKVAGRLAKRGYGAAKK